MSTFDMEQQGLRNTQVTNITQHYENETFQEVKKEHSQQQAGAHCSIIPAGALEA